jgi:hypothetical protein
MNSPSEETAAGRPVAAPPKVGGISQPYSGHPQGIPPAQDVNPHTFEVALPGLPSEQIAAQIEAAVVGQQARKTGGTLLRDLQAFGVILNRISPPDLEEIDASLTAYGYNLKRAVSVFAEPGRSLLQQGLARLQAGQPAEISIPTSERAIIDEAQDAPKRRRFTTLDLSQADKEQSLFDNAKQAFEDLSQIPCRGSEAFKELVSFGASLPRLEKELQMPAVPESELNAALAELTPDELKRSFMGVLTRIQSESFVLGNFDLSVLSDWLSHGFSGTRLGRFRLRRVEFEAEAAAPSGLYAETIVLPGNFPNTEKAWGSLVRQGVFPRELAKLEETFIQSRLWFRPSFMFPAAVAGVATFAAQLLFTKYGLGTISSETALTVMFSAGISSLIHGWRSRPRSAACGLSFCKLMPNLSGLSEPA